MENEEESTKPEIISAKIGAVPTQNAWSQAYSAGSLFAVLALTQEKGEAALSSVGKEVLDNLEKEYFTLEVKNLSSIKDAIDKTISRIPSSIKSSLIAAVIPFSSAYDNVLYVFVFGKGKIWLKRADKIGIILSSISETPEILSASGFLQNNDLIILETEKFASLVSQEKLFKASDDLPPSEIAESLSPEIHEKQEGDTSAIIIKYAKKDTEEEIIAEETQQKESYIKPQRLTNLFINLPHAKKMVLTISAVLVLILILSIFFAIKKKNDDKAQALFQNVYTSAEQKYNEGQSLLSLNKNAAKDDFNEAEKILLEAEKQFKKDSSQYLKLKELLQKVKTGLSQTSGIIVSKVQKTDKNNSLILAYAMEASKEKTLLTQDAEKIYKLSMQGATSIDKTKGTKKTIIKNDRDFQGVDGFSVYLGNIYVLDRRLNQILKFVNTGDSYVKSNYFKADAKPDLSNAISMAIDGSIWLLYKDGKIQQFTKGELQGFKNPTLDKAITDTASIFTDVDTNQLYVLDLKNKRIVVIGKDGVFQSQYSDEILAKTKSFDVVEKDKIVYVLIDKDVYKLELK